MDRYTARINLYGTTDRERSLNRLKKDILSNCNRSISYKPVKLNGSESQLIINSSTKPYYKNFTSLPRQTILAGDYIEWSNSTWLVYEADCDDEIYIDGKLYQCNYVQRWQDESGKIVERPSFVTRQSGDGESESKTIILGANEYFVYMPFDADTIKLRNGKRLFMDYYSKDPYSYKLSLPDNVSMKFGTKGVVCYLFQQTERSPDKDREIELISGEKIWIADYISPATPPDPEPTTKPYVASISSAKPEIAVGKSGRSFNSVFKDADGNVNSTIVPKWTIVSNFLNEMTVTETGSYIKIVVNNSKLIDKTFTLKLEATDDSAEPVEISILITSIYG